MDNDAIVMRKQMDETLAGLTDKLGELEHQVSGTVRTVKDSVNTVRDTLDLKLHVRRRPWTLLAGATALGFFGAYLSSRPGAGHPARNGRSAEHPYSDGDYARLPAAAGPSRLAKLGDRFQPEIAELKGIAIGALLGLARDIVTKQTSRPMQRSARDANNGPNGHSRD